MYKRNWFFILLALVLGLSACSAPAQGGQGVESGTAGPVEGWAVLAEKDDFSDVGKTDMLVDYIDIQRLKKVLQDAGWNSDHIQDLRGFDRAALQAKLDWLAAAADENDLVFFFITTHGMHLANDILWQDFFAQEWAQISSRRRVLLVDACLAARFTDVVNDDPGSQLTIAAVDEDEYGWKGLEEEGLPIIGAVFTYYFTEAFSGLEADADGNGMVSIQEASLFAEHHQREYMHQVVFDVPEFLQDYQQFGTAPDQDPTFPDVILNDAIGEPLYLTLDAN
jgi:hypothetical protein